MLMGVSSQKISVRLKRTVTHKATQTEALSWPGSEGPSSHFVLSSPRRTAQDTLYVLPSLRLHAPAQSWSGSGLSLSGRTKNPS